MPRPNATTAQESTGEAPQDIEDRRRITVIAPRRRWLEMPLSEVISYRELLFFFVWKDIKVRYKQTVIGAGWAILQPLFTMIVFTLFFGRLGKMPSGGLPYPVFYLTGLLPWMYFSGAMTHCTNTMVDNQRVITKVYFPRLLLPVSAVLPGLLDLAIAFVIAVPILLYYGFTMTMSVLLLPAFVALATLSALAIGLWLSALNARYRDVRYAVPFVVQLWMFLSPVAYPSSIVPQKYQWLYGLNPMVTVIEGFRWATTGQGRPSATLIAVSLAVTVATLIGGLIYFQRSEATIADVV